MNTAYHCSVYFVPEDDALDFIDDTWSNYLKNERQFTGKFKQTVQLDSPDQSLVLIGLGEADKIERSQLVEAGVHATQQLNEMKVTDADWLPINLTTIDSIEEVAKALFEGYLLADYAFDHYLTKKDQRSLQQITFPDLDNTNGLKEVETLVKGVHITRDLVNLRANDLYPATLAERVESIFDQLPVDVKVHDQAEIEALNMGALLAVSRASVHEPRFIVMKYLPEGEDQPAIGLVGKGVTYDSGGYAIKPGGSMATMMSDMGGAGAMIGTLYALAANNIQQNTIVVIAATENMIDGDAMKNGDIVTSMKQTTIEVDNTDAEGRLTLADALYYTATQLNVSQIVDAATLTGAAIVALGPETTAAMTNNQALLDQLMSSAQSVGESMWQLPINDHYRQKIKGKFADLKNSVPGGAGTITAGCFLEHFVEDLPWIHLDIAGPAYNTDPWSIYPRGASGIPVRTLYHYITSLA